MSIPAPVDETSPLMGPNRRPIPNGTDMASTSSSAGGQGGAGDTDTDTDTDKLEETKSSWYLFLLTLSIGGLQVVWSTEFSNGSPYLLSLGMSKSLLAFVWIAGPLTGSLVQPYIGICSDNCRSSWGKRKPFMVAGGAATIVILLALAWMREIVGVALGVFGVGVDGGSGKTVVIVAATIAMYCLDFAVNTVQAGIRCFIVDNAPSHQQEPANAWASRLTGVGNILGFIFGYIDLPRYLPFLGRTQFQVLCALASFSLFVTLLISCLYIKERDPRLEGLSDRGNPGLIAFFRQVFRSVKHLPPQIAKVCEVQIAAWVGWFPFLFYATTYIGQLYVNPILEAHPNLPDADLNEAWEKATRIGTFALLIYAIVSFVANISLPLFVVPTYKPVLTQEPEGPSHPEEEPFLGARRLSSSSLPVGAVFEAPPSIPEDKNVKVPEESTWASKLQIPGFTLRRAWFLSHVLFAGCMFSTFFIYTYHAATVVIGLVGISWALTLWAPFALISAEVARIDAERRIRRNQCEMAQSGELPATNGQHDDVENGTVSSTNDEELVQAGIILGLHNVAVSSPQILSSLVCSALFKAFQKPRGEPWDDSVGWVMRFGGCAAVVAAWLTRRLAEGRRQ